MFFFFPQSITITIITDLFCITFTKSFPTPPFALQYWHTKRKPLAGPAVKGRSYSQNNLPAHKTLDRLLLWSEEGSWKQTAACCTFGTKTGEDVRGGATEATVNSTEGSLSKHSSKFSTHDNCRMYHFDQMSVDLCLL